MQVWSIIQFLKKNGGQSISIFVIWVLMLLLAHTRMYRRVLKDMVNPLFFIALEIFILTQEIRKTNPSL